MLIMAILAIWLAGAISLWLALYAWQRRRDVPSAGWLAALMGGVSLWSLAYVGELSLRSPEGMRWASTVAYIGVVAVPVCWFGFALAQAGKGHLLTRWRILLLFLLPTAMVVLVATNPLHSLFYAHVRLRQYNNFFYQELTPGPFWWGHLTYSYLLVVAGIVCTVRLRARVRGTDRKRIGYILGGALVPYGISIGYTLFGFKPGGFLDLTPVGFMIMGLLFFHGVFRQGLFDVVPHALDVLFDHLPDALFVLDRHRTIVTANPAGARLLEQPVFQQAYIKEGLSANRAPRLMISEEDGGKDVDLAGKIRHLRILPLRTTSGPITGYLVMLQDITDRKEAENRLRESEERYALALHGAQDGMWDWNLQTNGVRYSPRWKAMLGYTEEEIRDELSEWWQRLAHPKDSRRGLATVEDYLAGRITDLAVEMRMRHKDGHWVPVLSRGGVVRDEEGRPVRMVGTHVDLTERKRLEAELIQLKKSESLGRMAGAVAHHYNNLMTVVLGNLELASGRATFPAEAVQQIDAARTAANRAADISRLMLAYLGQSTGTKKPLDLVATCREALAAITPRLLKNVRLTSSFPSPGPVVQGDAAQLRQILEALLTNAVEAIGEISGEISGKISITVGESSVSALPAGRMIPADWQPTVERHACLAVADTGPGMAPETLEQAFDPFFSTKFVGRGLGLPVVLGIVKAHGGAVFVENLPGTGAIIRVVLPLSDELLPEPSIRSEGISAAPPAEQGLMLVVDDEPALRSLAQAMFNNLGFEAIIAASGTEAVEIFRQHSQEIRCVLCDLTMPGMSGWETLTALRRIRADIPVILCSGYDEADVMADAGTELPQAFLGKPYGKKTLSDALAKALGKRMEENNATDRKKQPGNQDAAMVFRVEP